LQEKIAFEIAFTSNRASDLVQLEVVNLANSFSHICK
jgi:hypothetical protein